MPSSHVALRYLTRFRCVAQACEDSCCTGLTVALDRGSHDRLMMLYGTDDTARERVRRLVVLNEKATSDRDVAYLGSKDNGDCHFFDPDKLCSIQRRFGEAAIPDACSLFPRVVSRVGETIEVAAALSCPEIARLCLLAPDAVDRVPLDPNTLPRAYIGKSLPVAPADPYERHLEAVRETAYELLNDERYPLPTRFFFLAHLAERLKPFFRSAGEGGAPAAGGADVEAKLREEIGFLKAADERKSLHEWFGKLAVPDEAAVGVLHAALTARLQAPHGARLDRLIGGAFATYGITPGGAAPTTLPAAYRQRRDRLQERYGARIDGYFVRYSVNTWFRDWYTRRQTLASYVFAWLIRTALHRFVLVGQPALTPLIEAAAPPPDAEAVLDRAVVESFQVLTKELDHRVELLERLESAIMAGDEDVFGRSLFFAKV